MGLSCPYRPVPQKTSVPHVHQYLAETMTDEYGVYVLDCACGDRQRVRKASTGNVLELLPEAVVVGGGSLENAIFKRQRDGSFTDRWASIH
jgi:hypothetical protein